MDKTNVNSSDKSTAVKELSNNQLIGEERFERNVLNKKKFADINFIVGREKQIFPAHKLILSVKSTVFEAMFFGGLATKSTEIEIPDVEPCAFLALLHYFYSNEVQIDSKTVLSTLYAAKKYDVQVLENQCIDFLEKNLAIDNAFFCLSYARLFDLLQLELMCLEKIDKNTTDALVADCFTDIDLNTLILVLERDTLEVFESKLFQAIVSWSKAECFRKELPFTPENQRSVLGRAITLIRFSSMTLKEFVLGPVNSDLLTYSDVKSICKELALNKNLFERPRCSKSSKEIQVSFNDFVFMNKKIKFKWRLQDPKFVVGFTLKDNVDIGSNIVLKLIDDKESDTLCCISQCINSNLLIIFDRPIKLSPNTVYRVEVRSTEYSGGQKLCSDIISKMIYYK